MRKQVPDTWGEFCSEFNTFARFSDEQGLGGNMDLTSLIALKDYVERLIQTRIYKDEWPMKKPKLDFKPSINQHPDYERAKRICPACHSEFSRHLSGAAEYEVELKCTDCGHEFTLTQAAEVEIARRG